MILSPFSDSYFSIGSVFIIDIFFTLLIIIGFIVSRNVKKSHINSRFFIFLLLSYVCCTLYLKIEAENIAFSHLENINVSQETSYISTIPQPFSPFIWNVVVFNTSNNEYNITNINILEKNPKIEWEVISRWGNEDEEEIAKSAWYDKKFEFYRHFLQIPIFHKVIKTDNKICVYFEDLRFRNLYLENRFIYGLCATKDKQKYISHLTNNKEENFR